MHYAPTTLLGRPLQVTLRTLSRDYRRGEGVVAHYLSQLVQKRHPFSYDITDRKRYLLRPILSQAPPTPFRKLKATLVYC